jgi:hypothetical protein
MQRYIRLYDTKRHYATLYNSIQQYTRRYNTIYKAIRHHTTLYNVIQDYTTIYKAIRHCTTRYTRLYDTMQDYSTLYYTILHYRRLLYNTIETKQHYTTLYKTIRHYTTPYVISMFSFVVELTCACEQSLNIKSSIIFTFFFVNHDNICQHWTCLHHSVMIFKRSI